MYRNGAIEQRKCAIAKVNGMHSMILGGSPKGSCRMSSRFKDRVQPSFRNFRRRRDSADSVSKAQSRNTIWKSIIGYFRLTFCEGSTCSLSWGCPSPSLDCAKRNMRTGASPYSNDTGFRSARNVLLDENILDVKEMA